METTQEQRDKIVPRKKKKKEEGGGDLLVWRATSVLDWEDSGL